MKYQLGDPSRKWLTSFLGTKAAILAALAVLGVQAEAETSTQQSFTKFETRFLVNRDEAISLFLIDLPSGFGDALLEFDHLGVLNTDPNNLEFDDIDMYIIGVEDWNELNEKQQTWPEIPWLVFEQPDDPNSVSRYVDVETRTSDQNVRPVRFVTLRLGAFDKNGDRTNCVADYVYGTLAQTALQKGFAADTKRKSNGC
ncbi:hypothetical protein [Shimia thalassica]|uniref:hypothetical protein n=1 Tax=Shimia thalassica TaxID=1715693 RepID=UPI0026E234C6|nr:hypothetical protein [Shimia thalassica]MDO6478992.1 hypothetical protein [Shimia thalassica]